MQALKLSAKTDAGLGQSARIGLIVLQSDQTIEADFRELFHHGDVALYHSRIPNAMEVTPETLGQMEQDLPAAAALLPTQFDFDAIAYCCTSGTTTIGENRVEQLVKTHHPDAAVTTPLTATKAALSALGISNIALVTPYAADVTRDMRDHFANNGIRVNALASFDQSDDFKVARITTDSILNAIINIGKRSDCDGVFVSCTSLRTLPILQQAEQQIGKPVLSSNQALAWHLMLLTHLATDHLPYGRIFQTSLGSQ